jgi:hypothetical protein
MTFVAFDRSPPMMIAEAEHRLSSLGASNVRLSLMSVSAPQVPAAVLADVVRSAAAASDVVGMLGDGSIGVLSLRGLDKEDSDEIEERFIARLRLILQAEMFGRDVGPVSFRAVHRWACELIEASDLVDSLFDAGPVVLTLGHAA